MTVIFPNMGKNAFTACDLNGVLAFFKVHQHLPAKYFVSYGRAPKPYAVQICLHRLPAVDIYIGDAAHPCITFQKQAGHAKALAEEPIVPAMQIVGAFICFDPVLRPKPAA